MNVLYRAADFFFVTLPALIGKALGLPVCSCCLRVSRSWKRATDLGWRATTWTNPPTNQAVLCPNCRRGG